MLKMARKVQQQRSIFRLRLYIEKEAEQTVTIATLCETHLL